MTDACFLPGEEWIRIGDRITWSMYSNHFRCRHACASSSVAKVSSFRHENKRCAIIALCMQYYCIFWHSASERSLPPWNLDHMKGLKIRTGLLR